MRPMPELKIETVNIDELNLNPLNSKLHPAEQIDQIAASIEQFGNCDPLGVWTNDAGELVIVEGHGRYAALRKLGITEVPIIRLDHLSDEQRRAYGLVHNKLTMNSDFDFELLANELDMVTNIDMEDFGFSKIDLSDFDFGVTESEGENLSEEYSKNLGEVHYEPKDTDWKPQDLYEFDDDSFEELIEKVKDSEIRRMCELRKSWFCNFNFSRIADYYAYQATPDEQRLFEALGLVLLDRDNLIANGFADIVGEY